MNVYDRAILDWARARLPNIHKNKEVVSLEFEGWIGCYSSWTCDYGVTATIVLENGIRYDTEAGWVDVLDELPAFVSAREQMEKEHANTHGWNDYDEDI